MDAELRDAPSGRVAMVDEAMDLVRADGMGALTPDLLAARLDGCTQAVLLEFPNRHGLIAATVTRWFEHQLAPLVPVASAFGTVPFLHALLVANRRDPQLVRLLLATLATGSDPEHPLSAFLHQQHAAFRRQIRTFLAEDVTAGREPATMDPRCAAEQLVALYEGLLMQAVLHDDLDVVATFDRAAARMRHGWSKPYGCPPHFTAGG